MLGYQSYADFSADLRQHFVTRITPYTALKAATREKRSVADHIDHALEKALDNINTLKSDLDRQRIIELAKLIKRSRRVLVVGLDFAASLAIYLAYGLSALGFDAEAPTGSTGNSATQGGSLDAERCARGHQLRAMSEGYGRGGAAGQKAGRADFRDYRQRHDTDCTLL